MTDATARILVVDDVAENVRLPRGCRAARRRGHVGDGRRPCAEPPSRGEPDLGPLDVMMP